MRALTPAQRKYEEREQRERGTCSVLVAEIGPVVTKQTFTFHDDYLVQVELSFSSARSDTLRDIFVDASERRAEKPKKRWPLAGSRFAR